MTSELAFTIFRLGFLILLWLLILGAVAVLRKDIYGTVVTPRGKGRRSAGRGNPHAGNAGKREARAASTVQPKHLLVTGGPLTGTTVPLGSAVITIGRAPSSTLVLDDPYASSRHATLEEQNGDWIIADSGSTNGTFVDDERLAEPLRLAPGVTVRIGQTTFQLVK